MKKLLLLAIIFLGGATSVYAGEPNEKPVYKVYFSKNQYLPRGDQIVSIVKLVDDLKKNTDTKVTIIGHADSTGSTQVNEAISKHRAWQLGATLQQCGIDLNRLDVKWVGEKNPLVATEDNIAEADNRVVEIFMFLPPTKTR